MSRDLRKFLTTMRVPSLSDPTFITDFNQWAQAINENFEKIISAPYLKGDKGNSIETISIDVSAQTTPPNPDYDQYGLRTAIIAKINEFFGGDCEHDAVQTANSIDSLSKVMAFKDDVEGKIFVTNPYIFVDSRLNDISANAYFENFEDKTSAIAGVGTWDEATSSYVWNLGLYQILPTIYYDNDLSYWCWCVNGEKTGIIAQGVKGESGKDAAINIVAGHMGTGVDIGKLLIDYQLIGQYVEVDENNDEFIGWVDPDSEYWNLKEGDTIICYIIDANATLFDQTTTFQGLTYGITRVSNNQDNTTYWTLYNSNIDIIHSISLMKLREMLNNIGVPNNNSGQIAIDAVERGLYIPVHRPSPESNGSTIPINVHMLWSDSQFGNLQFGKVDYQQTCSNGDIYESDIQGVDANTGLGPGLAVYYNTNISGSARIRDNLTVAKNAVIAGNEQVGGDLNVIGDERVGGNLNVNGNEQVIGELDVIGNEQVGGNLDVIGNEQVGGNLNVIGNEQVGGNEHVGGTLEVDDVMTGHKTLSLDGVEEFVVEKQTTAIESPDPTLGEAVAIDVDLQSVSNNYISTVITQPILTATILSNFSATAVITITLGSIGYAENLIQERSTDANWWDPVMMDVVRYKKEVFLSSNLHETLSSSTPTKSYNLITDSFKIKHNTKTYRVSFSIKNVVGLDTTSKKTYHYIYISNATITDISSPNILQYKLTDYNISAVDGGTDIGMIPTDDTTGIIFWENKQIVPELPNPVHNVMVLRGRNTSKEAVGFIRSTITTKKFMDLGSYVMIDGNVNGYYTESKNTYRVLIDNGFISISSDTPVNKYSKLKIPNMRLFPKGIVGYIDSDNYSITQMQFPDSTYHNGGMWLDLSKGACQNVVTNFDISILNQQLTGFNPISTTDPWRIFILPTADLGSINATTKITFKFDYLDEHGAPGSETLVVNNIANQTVIANQPCVEIRFMFVLTPIGTSIIQTDAIAYNFAGSVTTYQNISKLSISATAPIDAADTDILNKKIRLVIVNNDGNISGNSRIWELYDGKSVLQSFTPELITIQSGQTPIKGIDHTIEIMTSSLTLSVKSVSDSF